VYCLPYRPQILRTGRLDLIDDASLDRQGAEETEKMADREALDLQVRVGGDSGAVESVVGGVMMHGIWV
jgi:hypothetical protein